MSEHVPTAKYRLTLVIDGNSHDEIEGELLTMTRGGYLLDSDYYERDTFHVVGGRRRSTLECRNPDMTPERYAAELDAWWVARKFAANNPTPTTHPSDTDEETKA